MMSLTVYCCAGTPSPLRVCAACAGRGGGGGQARKAIGASRQTTMPLAPVEPVYHAAATKLEMEVRGWAAPCRACAVQEFRIRVGKRRMVPVPAPAASTVPAPTARKIGTDS